MAEYEAQLQQSVDDYDATLEPSAQFERYSIDTAYQLLGLLSLETGYSDAAIDERVGFAAAYYSSDSKSIVVLDEGPTHTGTAMQVLAHEIVHALQDQQEDLREGHEAAAVNSDSAMAYSCLVEGEARVYEFLATAFMHDIPSDELFFEDLLDWSLKSAQSEVFASTAPLVAVRTRVRYPVGGFYVRERLDDGGNDAVHALFDTRPNTTAEWMNGYAGRESVAVEAPSCAPTRPPDGYREIADEVLGAFDLYAFLARLRRHEATLPIASTWSLATEWRGDRYQVFVDDAGSVAVSWRIRLASGAAQSVLESLESSAGWPFRASDALLLERERPVAKVTRSGEEILILAATGLDALDAWVGDELNVCP